MYRQGDVLLISVASLPDSGCERLTTDVVVHGEVTGHAHRIEGGTVMRHGSVGGMYVVAGTEARLVHEEHETINLPEGVYRVRRQREFDGEHIRYVYD